jgi:hypothetical protein
LRDITNLDLELIYGTRRSHDMSGLRYVKDFTLSNSKPKKSPTLKGKQPKNVFAKNVKPSIGRNGKPNNHAYQYRYTKWKTSNLPLGQKVIIGYTIGVIMVGLMTLKIKRFFRKLTNQMLHPNSPKSFKQIWFQKEKQAHLSCPKLKNLPYILSIILCKKKIMFQQGYFVTIIAKYATFH